MSEKRQTRKPTATPNGKGRGARCAAIVNAANAGLAVGGVALLIGTGADGCAVALAALAAVAGALIAVCIGKAVRNA